MEKTVSETLCKFRHRPCTGGQTAGANQRKDILRHGMRIDIVSVTPLPIERKERKESWKSRQRTD
jgi:hypothetical protein